MKTTCKKSNSAQIIKSAGFSTKRIETSKVKGFFGGVCNHVIALINAEDKVLHYEGSPYFPIGGKHSYAWLISTGDINADCFSFK